MEQYHGIIKKCPLFNTIKEDQYEFLLNCINAYIKTYNTGDYIFITGDNVNSLGIILSGAVEIIKENPAGSRHILSFLGPSNLFGEGIVCTKDRISPVSVHVKMPSKILMIPFDRVIRPCGNACDFHNLLIKNMIMLLGEKNMGLNYKIELLMIKGMREKLATYLLSESKIQHSNTFQIIPNRNELAEYLNVSRTSMCRELSRMKECGMIDYYQNSFQIKSIPLLTECLSEI